SILLSVSYFVYRRVYVSTGGHSELTISMGYVCFSFLSLVVPLSAIVAFEAMRSGLTGLCLFLVQLLATVLDFLARFFSREAFSPRKLFETSALSENEEEKEIPEPETSEPLVPLAVVEPTPFLPRIIGWLSSFTVKIEKKKTPLYDEENGESG